MKDFLKTKLDRTASYGLGGLLLLETHGAGVIQTIGEVTAAGEVIVGTVIAASAVGAHVVTRIKNRGDQK